ncbi:MAG: hypothetical protein WCI36_00545 [bacterium]
MQVNQENKIVRKRISNNGGTLSPLYEYFPLSLHITFSSEDQMHEYFEFLSSFQVHAKDDAE